MSIFRTKSENISNVIYISTALFIVAVLTHFLPIEIPYKLAFPLIILTTTSLWICPWQITCALALSAVGDMFGTCGFLLGQMGAFAAAHIFYIQFFTNRYREKVRVNGKIAGKAAGYIFLISFLGIVFASFIFTQITPEVPEGIIRAGASVYTLVICMMLMLALLQRSSLYAIGAILFTFSDFILAWNIFVDPIKGAGYLIMTPYYLGQWLLFIRSSPYRISGIRIHRM